MKVVRAALRDDVDHRSGIAAELSRVVGRLHAKLPQRVQGRDRQGIIVEFLPADFHAVDQDYRRVVSLASNREPGAVIRLTLSSAGASSVYHTGRQRDQLHEVAAVERQPHKALVIDDLRQACVRRLEQHRVGADADGFVDRANLKRDVDNSGLRYFESDILDHHFLEAGLVRLQSGKCRTAVSGIRRILPRSSFAPVC